MLLRVPFFYDILQQFQHAFFSLQWDQQGLHHEVFGINFTVGNGQDFKNTWHIDPIICHFLNFFSSKFKDTAYDLPHTFSSLHNPKPCMTASADLPSCLQPEMITAVLGRPPLVDNHSLTPGWNACDALGDPVKLRAKGLHPDCHWLNRGNEDVLWNAMEWANKLHIKSS